MNYAQNCLKSALYNEVLMKLHYTLSPASLNSNLRSFVKSSDIILGCHNRYNIAHELAGMSGSVIL